MRIQTNLHSFLENFLSQQGIEGLLLLINQAKDNSTLGWYWMPFQRGLEMHWQ